NCKCRWYDREGGFGNDGEFREPTIEVSACDQGVLATGKVPLPAGVADKAVSSMKTYTDAVAHLPAGHSCTHRVHGSSNFMARHARKLNTGEAIILHVQITGTNATGLDTQAHLTSPRGGHRLCRYLDSTAGMGKLGRTHG